MTSKHRWLLSAVASGATEVLSRGTAFLFFVLAARHLGVVAFGEFRALLALAQFASGLAVPFLTAMSRAAGRHAPQAAEGPQGHRDEDVVGIEASAWLYLSIAAGMIAVAFFAGRWNLAAAAFIATLGFSANNYTGVVARSFNLGQSLVVARLGSSLLQLLSVPAGVALGLVDTDLLTWAYGLAFIAPLAFVGPLRRTLRLPLASAGQIVSRARTHARDLLGLLGHQAAHSAVITVDLLVMHLVAPAPETGIFAAARNVSLLLLLPAYSLFHFIIPARVRALRGEDPRTATRLTALGVASVIVVAVALIATVPALVPFLFGDAFSGATAVARYSIIGYALYSIVLICSANWVGEGRTSLFNLLVGIVVSILAALLLATPLGGTALAASQAAAASYAVLFIAALAIDLRRRRPQS